MTLRSTLGAIVFETGGMLVNNGWIRHLESYSRALGRSLVEWNKVFGLGFEDGYPPCIVIGDDVIGGLFAINGGLLDQSNLGKVFYFSSEALQWEMLDIPRLSNT
jgi:hypothetical protein